MNPDHSPQFGSISQKRQPWTRWGASLFIHVLLVALLLTLPVFVPGNPASHKRPELTALYRPKLQKPLHTAPVRRSAIVTEGARSAAPTQVIVTEIRPPRPAFEMPRSDARRPELTRADRGLIEAPRLEAVSAPALMDVPAQPLPPLRNARIVQTGVFAGPRVETASMTGRSALSSEVRTGGFSASAGSGSPGNSLQGTVRGVGAFDRAAGPSGAGLPRAAGDGVSGFNIPAPEPTRGANAGKPPASGAVSTPVEILYKPKPVYTEEARTKGVEGEVQLEVRFCSNGRIEVLGVVRSLGYGLDEAARLAASQIRFRPGARDGVPVDLQGIVHIVFERS